MKGDGFAGCFALYNAFGFCAFFRCGKVAVELLDVLFRWFKFVAGGIWCAAVCEVRLGV
jgi:hypothetical protein